MTSPNGAPALPGTHELIRTRWSPRAFSNREVAPEELHALLEAARWAASSFNEQPWRFLIAGRADGEAYRKLFESLVDANRKWAGDAPVLLLTVSKRTFTHNGAPNRYALHDAGMALANLMLQATSMGLSVHAMGGFDHDKARAAFGVPDEYELGAVAAIGYPLGEAPSRSRKPLSELVFSGAWGKPASL